MLSESLFGEAAREFESKQCAVCGQRKRKRQSFCARCYFSLPKNMQQDLWNPFGGGYEEAYSAAKDWINEERKASAK